MQAKAAITVLGAPEEIERLWRSRQEIDGQVSFRPAPGDRGTEIHVELSTRGPFGGPALARVKDQLRHFKAQVETGQVPRSEGTPEGERMERKFKQRPAQPMSEVA
jgi:uncharacterized membrane protein